MEDFQNFYFSPQDSALSRLVAEATAITVVKAGGEIVELEPCEGLVTVIEEHPQVNRMDGDLGAICEVFKQQRFYYLTLQGIRLAAGDQVIFRFHEAHRDTNQSRQVLLKVVDVENERARVESAG